MDIETTEKPRLRKRIADRIAIALVVAGLSSVAQADHCVQGTICYPDPADLCGLNGAMWCYDGGEDGTLHDLPQIMIPHRPENPYFVDCGASDTAQMAKSISFDVLAFMRDNGYKDLVYDTPPFQIRVGDYQYTYQFSDGSWATSATGMLYAPGQYNAAWLQYPVSDYQYYTFANYVAYPMATAFLGPDENGYVFSTFLMGTTTLEDPNTLRLCYKSPS